MAGLLDNKSRLIDAAFTLSGKSQAFAGGLRVKYVTFSDIGAKYEGDENEISKIEKSCCHPNYKIGEKIIIVLKTTDINIEFYFHRYKNGFKFNVDNAIEY